MEPQHATVDAHQLAEIDIGILQKADTSQLRIKLSNGVILYFKNFGKLPAQS